jgi:hypothetical protein
VANPNDQTRDKILRHPYQVHKKARWLTPNSSVQSTRAPELAIPSS